VDEVEPKLDRVQSVTVISAAAKLVVASLLVKVRATPPVLVEPPLVTVEEVIVIVGWVLSMVTEPDPEVTSVPVLPLASPKLIV
jgi:hypothetical protein